MRIPLPLLAVYGFLMLCANIIVAQETKESDSLSIIIGALPSRTPENDPLYLTGSFNNWLPNDENYRMRLNQEGQWYFNFPSDTRSFEYKITRGSFEKVEGDKVGKPINNRVFINNGLSQRIIKVHSWEDMFKVGNAATYIVIDALPDNSPDEPTIFITGSFNDWLPRDINYQLFPNTEGKYTVALPADLMYFEYKFTRGSWKSVEGGANGQVLANRKFTRTGVSDTTIYVNISNWEDLVVPQANTFVLYNNFVIFFIIFLMISIFGAAHVGVIVRNLLNGVVILIGVSLTLRTLAAYFKDVTQESPVIYAIPEVVLTILPPIAYMLIKRLTGDPDKKVPFYWWYLLPFMVIFLMYSPFWLAEEKALLDMYLYREWVGLFWLGGLILAIWIGIMLYKCHQKIAVSTQKPGLLMVARVLSWQWTFAFAVLVVDGCLVAVDQFVKHDLIHISEYVMSIAWFSLSLTPFIIGYFLIAFPQIFNLRSLHTIKGKSPARAFSISGIGDNSSNVSSEEIEKYKGRLTELMNDKEVFRDANLTLSGLAAKVGTNAHTLSKVINEGFGKNFYDYINGYRVDAFKEYIIQHKDKEETIMALAFKSGFNSKTAFNRAFKKIMGCSPSELRDRLNL